MNLTLRNDYGRVEAVIDESCGFDKFYGVAGLLSDKLQVNFTNKIDDLNTSYWDFSFKGHKLTLHYNIYDGVSISSVSNKDAALKHNEAVKELATMLQDLQ